MQFNVPIAGHGDCYDRYLVRLQASSRARVLPCLFARPRPP